MEDQWLFTRDSGTGNRFGENLGFHQLPGLPEVGRIGGSRLRLSLGVRAVTGRNEPTASQCRRDCHHRPPPISQSGSNNPARFHRRSIVSSWLILCSNTTRHEQHRTIPKPARPQTGIETGSGAMRFEAVRKRLFHKSSARTGDPGHHIIANRKFAASGRRSMMESRSDRPLTQAKRICDYTHGAQAHRGTQYHFCSSW